MLKKIHITSPIVSTDWLQEHLHATNLVVLNGTIPRVTSTNISEETQQIPKARFFDIKKKFSQEDALFPNTMVSVETFTKEAQKLGIHQDSAIVVYDEFGIYSSPRVWYMFRVMGFDNIAVLDGGFPTWKKAGYSLETKRTYIGEYGDFQGKDSLYLFKNYKEMQQEVLNLDSLIIDARSENRFTGKIPEPRAGLRSGQIPNSKNLPYTNVLRNYSFKNAEEIRAIFEKFSKSNPSFIFSCGSGITACILALAAEIAGYHNFSVYDGSWTEWGTLSTEISMNTSNL